MPATPTRQSAYLDQALDFAASSLGREHSLRVDLLSTLGEILFEQRHLEQAEAIQREVLEYRIRNSGSNHSSSLKAKICPWDRLLPGTLPERRQRRRASHSHA
jgi:hypothetical protein